jgi:hypothetical protein
VSGAKLKLTSGILAASCVALALALRLTGFHVVPRPEGLFRGITDPPSLARLAVSILVGAVLAVPFSRLGDASRPLVILALAALPAIPVLWGWGEPLLVFQGGVLPLLATSAMGAALVLAIDPVTGRGASRGVSRFVRLGEPALVSMAFLFYALLGTRLPGLAGPQGDEPHYLLMSESLLHDHTLDLTHALKRKAYADFYAGVLESHTSPMSPPGKSFSVHTPGLSVLILPAYALFGYPGARLLVGFVAALTTGLVHRLVREVSGSPGLAKAAWGVVTFLPPLPFYAVAIYPEVPACCATALFLLAGRARRPPSLVVTAVLAAAALPWLHPKFLPLALLGITLALLRPCLAALRVAGGTLFALSVAILIVVFKTLYGKASLAAAYGPTFVHDVSLTHVPWGVAGLLVDRQYGLLLFAPVFVLAVPGAIALFEWRPGDALRALLLGGASIGVGAAFSMWWGGACPPGRFLLPALPALTLALVLALPPKRVLAGCLAGLGASILALAVEAPRAIHNRADGESGLLRCLAPALNLSQRLPSFVAHDPVAVLLGLTLLAALFLGWSRGWKGLLLGSVAYVCVAEALARAPLIDRREATLALLEAWDGTNLSAPLDLPSLELPLDLPGAPWRVDKTDLRSSRRIDLPPGLYAVRLQGHALESAPQKHVTRITLVADELELLRTYLREGLPVAETPLLLPGGVRRLQVEARGAEGIGLVEGISLVPEALVPRSKRGEFRWPRLPTEDRYRVGSGDVRVTALDRSAPSGETFTLVGDEGTFLLEAPAQSAVLLRVSRPHPGPKDSLFWSGRAIPLENTPALATLTLKPEEGALLGGTAVVPLRLRSYGASIGWSGSALVTSATSSRDASPPSLPTVTTRSYPPESGKK